MKPFIKKNDPDKEFFFQEGCHIIEVSNSEDDQQLSIARARVAPGATTKWHRLMGTTERYAIISGEGIVEIGDLDPVRVCAGDVVVIPPMCRQRITSTGTTDLVFYAICTPRFETSNYQDCDPG